MIQDWVQFVAVTLVIIYAGSQLSKYGDVIAEKTGLGRLWIGALLMAAVTSLPELFSGVSAAGLYDLPDIAVGGVTGSCMFNILIAGLAITLSGRRFAATRPDAGHGLAAGFGILLLALVALGIYVPALSPAVGWVGGITILVIPLYLVAMRVLFTYNKRRLGDLLADGGAAFAYRHISKRRAYSLYAVNALVIVAAALYLPYLGGRIAAATGLGQTFVGNFFVAGATSLPEIVVTAAAVRMGSLDLALGNLFGSNLFNVAILGVTDVAYTRGPILAGCDPHQGMAALFGVMMTAVALVGLFYRTVRRQPAGMGWDVAAVFVLYAAGQAALLLMR